MARALAKFMKKYAPKYGSRYGICTPRGKVVHRGFSREEALAWIDCHGYESYNGKYNGYRIVRRTTDNKGWFITESGNRLSSLWKRA